MPLSSLPLLLGIFGRCWNLVPVRIGSGVHAPVCVRRCVALTVVASGCFFCIGHPRPPNLFLLSFFGLAEETSGAPRSSAIWSWVPALDTVGGVLDRGEWQVWRAAWNVGVSLPFPIAAARICWRRKSSFRYSSGLASGFVAAVLLGSPHSEVAVIRHSQQVAAAVVGSINSVLAVAWCSSPRLCHWVCLDRLFLARPIARGGEISFSFRTRSRDRH